MKIRLTTVTIALVSVQGFAGFMGFAQSARTGVSSPDAVVITAQPDETTPVRAPGAKPSAAIPLTPRPLGNGADEAYGAYVPYRGAGAVPLANAGSGVAADPDAGIVTSVEERAGEVREGTLLRARIKQRLSTVTTAPGSMFTAELSEPVEKDGRVVLPIGAVIEGRVTEVHGGTRISGGAMMHLQPRSVTLPDGTHYDIHAQLIDIDQFGHVKVDREGTVVRQSHPKETLAAVGLAAGGAAAAGAVIGGGVGAVVGAGVGAGTGAIWWLKQDRQAVLPEDSMLVFSLTEAMPVMPVGSNPMSRLVPAAAAASPRVAQGNPADGIVE